MLSGTQVLWMDLKKTTSQRESGLPQARALARAVGFPSLPEPSGLRRDLPEAIAAVKTELHAVVKQQRKTDNILHEPGALSRWLRNRQAPLLPGSPQGAPLRESRTSGAQGPSQPLLLRSCLVRSSKTESGTKVASIGRLLILSTWSALSGRLRAAGARTGGMPLSFGTCKL